MSQSDVVIVGGGVIGAMSAYYLSQAGWKVTIADRSEFGRACSHGNCGFVCPSHVLPLAMPGAIAQTMKSLLARNSPFSIKPRLSLSLWQWLWKFARRCNRHDMLQAAQGIRALLDSSRTLYTDLIRDEKLDCEWETRGLLFVFQHAQAMEHHAELAHLLNDQFQTRSQRYDGPALNTLEPALKPGLAGGWLYPDDAHLRPDKLMTSLRHLLENRGVKILDNCEVQGLSRKAGQGDILSTSQGEFRAGAYVFATGAWTPILNSQLGCNIPIQPGKGYSLTMPRPGNCPTYPLIFEEHRVAVTPVKSGYRIGSTMEFAGYDSSISPKRLNLLREGAKHYLQEPEAAPISETWYGWRPMTWDSLPIIDRSPAMSNVWIAAGHNMLGLSMAPATGKLLMEVMNGTTPHVEPGAYSAKRFS